jgi:hypothetical protein
MDPLSSLTQTLSFMDGQPIAPLALTSVGALMMANRAITGVRSGGKTDQWRCWSADYASVFRSWSGDMPQVENCPVLTTESPGYIIIASIDEPLHVCPKSSVAH